MVRATASAVWNAGLRRPAVASWRATTPRDKALERWSLLDVARSTSVNSDMSTDPDQIRAQIAALLADLPDLDADPDSADVDIDSVAARLEEAHDLLVQALESVEKGRRAETRTGKARDAARSC